MYLCVWVGGCVRRQDLTADEWAEEAEDHMDGGWSEATHLMELEEELVAPHAAEQEARDRVAAEVAAMDGSSAAGGPGDSEA